MRHLRFITPIFLCAMVTSACNGDVGISESESQRIFSTSTGLLHQIHLAEIPTNQDVPESHSVACAGGGTVEMGVQFDGVGTMFSNIVGITHVFVDCRHDGLTLDGPLDYTNIVIHGGGVCFDIDINGSLDIGDIGGDIQGPCEITARETCDGIDAVACGYPL